MTRSTPSNMSFQVFLAKTWKIENPLLKISKKTPICCFASRLQCPTNILEEMHMTELNDARRIGMKSCHANRFIIITDEREQFITSILEFDEELYESLVILAWSKHTNRNIVCEIINAVNERNLAVITFHRYELSINNKKPAESLRVAISECYLVIMRKY